MYPLPECTRLGDFVRFSFMLSPLLWGGVASVSDFEPEWFMGRENVVFERRNLTFLLKMNG